MVQLHPAGAQGANMAIQDAVALANWINVIATPQVKDVEKAFKAFKEERYAAAQVANNLSKSMCRFYGKVRVLSQFLIGGLLTGDFFLSLTKGFSLGPLPLYPRQLTLAHLLRASSPRTCPCGCGDT